MPAGGLEIREAKGMGVYVKAGGLPGAQTSGRKWPSCNPLQRSKKGYPSLCSLTNRCEFLLEIGGVQHDKNMIQNIDKA